MKTITAWVIAVVTTLGIGAVAVHYETEAERQDIEALSSRHFAGQAVCGPHATPEWLDDKTLQCLRHIDPPATAAATDAAAVLVAGAAR